MVLWVFVSNRNKDNGNYSSVIHYAQCQFVIPYKKTSRTHIISSHSSHVPECDQLNRRRYHVYFDRFARTRTSSSTQTHSDVPPAPAPPPSLQTSYSSIWIAHAQLFVDNYRWQSVYTIQYVHIVCVCMNNAVIECTTQPGRQSKHRNCIHIIYF